ncbi:MAG: SDR family oxidoreductase [Myxococcales bacterium]|nr:SDR family oxidoreductase [Myxococcales bacterium]MCB9526127.1 SDR family oxidoreductase [Myxococcales bacterium]
MGHDRDDDVADDAEGGAAGGDHDGAEDVTEQVHAATALLEALVANRGLLAPIDDELRERFLIAAGQVSRPDKRARKALARARQRGQKRERKAQDQALLNQTGIRQLRENPIFQTPRHQPLLAAPEAVSDPRGEVAEERVCYTCRARYTEVHFFYDQLCRPCGDLNFAKRSPTADLRGRVALVTGARVKIGYQAAILLLRAGCEVHVATRFPKDAARRYAAEPDFAEWGQRVHIHGIDLRHTPSVEALCRRLLQDLTRLDFIINNACQTVRRPPKFYEHMLELELQAGGLAPEAQRLLAGGVGTGGELVAGGEPGSPAALSQFELVPEDAERGHHLFPAGELDADLQQVDLRRVNSWRLKLADVSAVELLEVHLVNAVAPFIINARLKPLMQAVPTADKHIVNVSAMEGQFYRIFKTDRHPHTNMAKASLNMMTRTSALDYIEDGIHMNSVDTGWVTDEDPAHHAELKREIHRFHPPLDIVDGAARIVDPIFHGISTGEHVWGQFLKDYKPTDW